MTNPENETQDENSRSKQVKDRADGEHEADGEQHNDDKAPGKNSESGYPDDSYWEQSTRENSKESPAEVPEPDTGYRWESSEDNTSAEADSKERNS